MKKFLIFGSSGFIGSALSSFLRDSGNLVYGSDVVPSETNRLNGFLKYDESKEFFKNIFSNQFDVCVNCAGSASVPFSFQQPFRDYELNTRITFLLLTAIKENNPLCRFINLSSAAVYGNPGKLPIKESDKVAPISPYGSHKFMSEMICDEFSKYFNIKACSLRIFSAYGPGLKKQLFWDLYQKAKEGNAVKLFGEGSETRDFIFIDDLIRAINLVSESNFEYPVINIANGEEIKISEAAGIFFKEFNSKLEYSFSKEKKEGDPVHWCADINLLKTLGYKPRVDLESGILKYISWLKSL